MTAGKWMDRPGMRERWWCFHEGQRQRMRVRKKMVKADMVWIRENWGQGYKVIQIYAVNGRM